MPPPSLSPETRPKPALPSCGSLLGGREKLFVAFESLVDALSERRVQGLCPLPSPLLHPHFREHFGNGSQASLLAQRPFASGTTRS